MDNKVMVWFIAQKIQVNSCFIDLISDWHDG